jgi:hypothetical protein
VFESEESNMFNRYDIYEVLPDDSLAWVCSCRDIMIAGEKLKEFARLNGKAYWAVEIETGKKILRSMAARATSCS